MLLIRLWNGLPEVAVIDTSTLQKKKDYVNERQYRYEAKKRWGLSKKEAKERWQTLMNDSRVPKAYDEEGWLCMPALSGIAWLDLNRTVSLSFWSIYILRIANYFFWLKFSWETINLWA